MNDDTIARWLSPLRDVLDATRTVNWARLHELAAALDEALARCPISPDIAPGPEFSRRLLWVRRELVARHRFGDEPSLWQLLAQFVCGYRDIDLRDATGLGHGRLIARHGGPALRARWLPRLLKGELAGVAITEPHGGSRVVETRTRAVPSPDGHLLISGRKCWISRLAEAAVFVVFFRSPSGELTAAAIGRTSVGLHRDPCPPTGLAGWSWGVLDLDRVRVDPEDMLIGDGMAVLREHFATYRPWVAATALGGAASVFDTVTTVLTSRGLPRLRDNALITIGRTHAQLSTALLGCAVAECMAATGHPDAERWSAGAKAHGVDVAHQATAELALLAGAAGFRSDSTIAKTGRDLGGLLFADGVHDSLYRSAGKHHTRSPRPLPAERRFAVTIPLQDEPTSSIGAESVSTMK